MAFWSGVPSLYFRVSCLKEIERHGNTEKVLNHSRSRATISLNYHYKISSNTPQLLLILKPNEDVSINIQQWVLPAPQWQGNIASVLSLSTITSATRQSDIILAGIIQCMYVCKVVKRGIDIKSKRLWL